MQLLLMHIDFHTHKNWFSFIINEQDYLPSKKKLECKMYVSCIGVSRLLSLMNAKSHGGLY